MAYEIGYSVVGTAGHHGHADYLIYLNMLDAVTIGDKDGVVTNGKIYTRLYSGPGTAEYRMYIYEIGATDALSPLIASSSIVSSNSESYQWLTIPFLSTVTLKAGKTYAVAFSSRGIEGVIPYFKYDGGTDTHRTYSGSSFDAPSDLTDFESLSSDVRHSAYIEYIDDSPAGVKLLAPVNAQPMLTSGRNESGYSSGHEPKYVLDNDPNTYWEPDSFNDRSLYIDLGTAIAVDVVALWLHNYNEDYTAGNRRWKVAYSDDDSTYTTISDYLFSNSRDDYVPIIIMTMTNPITARYWRITFTNFNTVPETIKPEISCVWFLNDYSLPYHHQVPEENVKIYNNFNIESRAGIEFSQLGTRGYQRDIARTYVFIADQWDNLLAAYNASRGGSLPIIVRANTDDAYQAMYFTKPLQKRKEEHDFQRPTIYLKEIGFKRIPYRDLSLTLAWPVNSAVWHFRNNFEDSGPEGHHFTITSGTTFQHGVSERGITAVQVISGWLSIPNGSATDFVKFDMDDFTMEWWIRGTRYSLLVNHTDNWPATNGGLKLEAGNDGQMEYTIGDVDGNAVTDYGASAHWVFGNSLSDAVWRHVALTVNRTTDQLCLYIDGQLVHTKDISSITGNIRCTTRDFQSVGGGDVVLDEMTVTRGLAMDATLIYDRYRGRLNYGDYKC